MPYTKMHDAHPAGVPATVAALMSALLSYLAPIDAVLHTLGTLVAIVAGGLSIAHYIRAWLRDKKDNID